MYNIFYVSLFIASIICLLLLIKLFKKQATFYYVLLFTALAIENFGYMQVCSAQNLQSGLYGNQCVYLGACFVPFFCIMCVSQLCQAKPNKIFEYFSLLIGIVIFSCVSTIGVYPFYYKTVDLIVTSDYSYFVKEYGPLHLLYPFYLIFMVCVGFGIIIHSYRKRRKISYVTSTALTITMSLTIIVYLLERGLKFKIELMPITFIIMEIVLLFLLGRIRRYDLWGLSAESIAESKDYGFIIYSSKGKLLGLDDVSREWFPELNNLYIDYEIKDTSTDFLKQIQSWINNSSDKQICHFERNEKIIEAKNILVSSKRGYQIYCINLRDDTDQQKIARLMKELNETLEQKVSEKTEQLTKVQEDIILSMASIVENRDNNTGGHIRRTSDVVDIFVRHLQSTKKFSQLNKKTAKAIIKAAPLHDFGKIAIPDVILNKPGKFEPEEYEIMKLHSAKGAVIVAEILQNSNDSFFRQIAVNIAHYHHEKWNGEGYPVGLAAEKIPFEARIMALADVFDALVSKRVYKDSFSYDKAFSIIEESCGTHFDPELCKEFLKCRPQLEELFNSYED